MCLFDQMQYSYDELKDDTEIAIINKHWFKTKRHTILCVCKEILYDSFILNIT